MHEFTAFCQSSDGTGAVWIGKVQTKENDVNEAVNLARVSCAHDWGIRPEDAANEVHVLGIATGVVQIVYWQDICDS